MTLTDVLEPSLTIIAHAELKGLQYGAGLAAAAAVPTLWISPSSINAANEPPLVAVARCAGIGAAAGATVVGINAALKLTQLDAAGIRDRAQRLRDNAAQGQIDTGAAAGAGVGLALVAVRVQKIAEAEGVALGDVAMTSAAAWEVFCFAALGMAAGAAVVKLARGGVKLVEEKGEDVQEAVENGAQEVQKAGREARDRGARAADQAGDKAEEAVDEAADGVKGAADGVKNSVDRNTNA